MIEFKNLDTNETLSFESKCNVLYCSDPLALALKTPINVNKYKNWSLKTNNQEIEFNNVAQLRVNITGIGSILFYFTQEYFTKEIRETIFPRISELKSLPIYSSQNRKDKIFAVLKTLEEFKPLVAYFSIEKHFDEIVTYIKSDYDKEKSYHLFVALEIELKEPKKEPKQEDKKPEVKKEKVKTEDKPKEHIKFSFSDLFTRISLNLKDEGISYLFNSIYTMLLAAVALFMFIFFNKTDSTGYGVLFIFFIIIFMLVIAGNLRIFIKKKDLREWKSMLGTLITFNAVAIVGIGLGILIAYSVSESFLKEEDLIINYQLYIPLSLLIAFIGYLASIIGGYFFDRLVGKSKTPNNKENSDGDNE